MGNNYQYISTAATTVIGNASGPRRINLHGIFINKVTTGTVTVRSGASTIIGVIAIGAAAGVYWQATEAGVTIQDLQIVTSAADDVTIAYSNL